MDGKQHPSYLLLSVPIFFFGHKRVLWIHVFFSIVWVETRKECGWMSAACDLLEVVVFGFWGFFLGGGIQCSRFLMNCILSVLLHWHNVAMFALQTLQGTCVCFFKTDLFTKINQGNTILFISVIFQKATFWTNSTQSNLFEMIHFSVFPDKKTL